MPPADRKMRYAGLLENPHVSRLQRDILDFGRWQGLAPLMKALSPSEVLDVGCGLGEHCQLFRRGYVGVDNSAPRIAYARRKYPGAGFILGDGVSLPVKPRSFDLVMMLDTSHHLTDAEFVSALATMAGISRRWVLVSDPVFSEGQSAISRFFYSLDRGAAFRDESGMRRLIGQCRGVALDSVSGFITFPGLYRRGSFLMTVRGSGGDQ
jgi:SAM-dependent methyltransferase